MNDCNMAGKREKEMQNFATDDANLHIELLQSLLQALLHLEFKGASIGDRVRLSTVQYAKSR